MEPGESDTGHLIPTDEGPKLSLDQDEATMLSRDLHQRTLAYVQQNLADPLSMAQNAAERVDEITGHSGTYSATTEIRALSREIDQLPPAVAKEAYNPEPNPEGRVVPDSTVKAMHAALRQAEKLTKWGTANQPKADQVRAAGEVLYGYLAQIDGMLGPEPVNSNIVDPAVQRFAS